MITMLYFKTNCEVKQESQDLMRGGIPRRELDEAEEAIFPRIADAVGAQAAGAFHRFSEVREEAGQIKSD